MIPQTRDMLVPGARIRTLVNRLESADEGQGVQLEVLGQATDYGDDRYVIQASGNRGQRWVFRAQRNDMHQWGLGAGFEIVSSPAYRAPAPTPVAKSFDSEAWLAQLMSQTGRSRISDEMKAKLLACTDKNTMNKEFFEYVKATPVEVQTLPDSAITSLDSIITPRTSPEYLQAQANKDRSIREAIDYSRRMDERLAMAVQEEERMMQIEQRTSVPLSAKINDVLKAGWYELDVADMKAQGTTVQRVTFITPPITITHFNSKAAIEMRVPMGSYKVHWFPRQAQIKVSPHIGHIAVDGYLHPHVTGEGGICWGNARDVHAKGMSNFDPKPSLDALQVILQNYNPDSPYVRLDRWEVLRMRDKYAGMPTKYVQHDRRAWIDENDMPESHATTYQLDSDTYEDDDGDERTRYKMIIFKKVYENGAEIPDEEDKWYIKHRNGRYHQVEIYDWD